MLPTPTLQGQGEGPRPHPGILREMACGLSLSCGGFSTAGCGDSLRRASAETYNLLPDLRGLVVAPARWGSSAPLGLLMAPAGLFLVRAPLRSLTPGQHFASLVGKYLFLFVPLRKRALKAVPNTVSWRP